MFEANEERLMPPGKQCAALLAILNDNRHCRLYLGEDIQSQK